VGADVPTHPTSRVHGRASSTPGAVLNPEGLTMTKRLAALIAAALSFIVVLTVALWGAQFGIDGNLSRSLTPGATVPINVRITNPHFYPIVVDKVTVRIVRIIPARKGDHCAASNFTLTQGAPLAVRIDAYAKTTLEASAPGTSELPSLRLTDNRAKLEDGCQGATIQLGYSAAGSWWTK
jgi:hypothetical protein